MEQESVESSDNEARRAGLKEDTPVDGTAPGPDGQTQASGANQESEPSRPFSFEIESDAMQWALFFVAIATRMWRLDHPRGVVFDELHYGRYTALYRERRFFFDQNPPLGKLLLTAGACLCGFDGEYKFERIGTDYSSDVPVFCMRAMPALFGALLVPTVYQLMVELKLSRWTAAFASCLVVFDNALLTQSRFMLMESFLLLFIALSLLSLVKFIKHNQRCPFSIQWWAWLTLLGVSIGCSVSVKYIGLMTAVLVLLIVARDLWQMLADSSLSDMQLVHHLLARVGMLLVVPVGVYLSVFYVHLSILTKAGPHDDIMTSAFQSSLEGGLSAITRAQPVDVAYGSQVTLRQTHSSRPCWLHSHPDVYPLRYPDGRGSSHQQQVTCYFYKDVNNWWLVKDPNRTSLMVDDPVRPVKHGDIVELIHGTTSRALNSHDVAAPLSPDHQEVTCYIDYNISISAQSLWRVEIVNRDTEGSTWKTIRSQVNLIHLNTSQVLKTSGKQLPEWGFHQLEVVTDKLHDHATTLWNVEEHRYTRIEGEETSSREFTKADLFPLNPTQLGFLSKFWEIQVKMLYPHQSAPLEHRYSSGPLDWPLMDTNIAYWVDPHTNAQIHLLGNPVTWYSATLAVLVYASLFAFYVIRRHRHCYDISEAEWRRFVWVGEIACGGYLLHYVPHFLSDSTFFLHHYLPAYVFSMILLAFLVQHVYRVMWSPVMRNIYLMLILVWFTAVVNVFVTFSVFSYGNHPVSDALVKALQWRDAWDFIEPARHLVDKT